VFAVVFFVASFGVASWALRLAESRQNESVVQQLQLQLERGNVGRRALLLEMLRRGVVSSSLEPADLESLEAVFLTADSDQLRQTIALALLRNRQLFPTLAAGPGSGRETWLDTLRQLQQTDLATADAQSVEAAWRQAQPTQRE
jgi:hypothetical protein